MSMSDSFGLPEVQVPRDVPIVKHDFIDYFKGFEKVPAVQELFGNATDRVLSELKVEFFSARIGYMGVSDEDGHLVVSANYLKEGDLRSIYLDLVHELVHVMQFREGKRLFDESYEYVERPTELEAYGHAVKEARRLGMSDDVDEDEVQRLARNIGIDVPQKSGPARGVRIH